MFDWKIDGIGLFFFVVGILFSHWLSTRLCGWVNWLCGGAMKPWLCEPIEPRDLPGKHREFFEKHTPAYLALGFKPIGDFVLIKQPKLSTIRVFLSPDGETIGTINAYKGTFACSCVSLFADGTYAETSTIDFVVEPPPEHKLLFSRSADKEIAGIWQRHNSATEEFAGHRETSRLELEAEDWRDVLNYGHRLVARSVHAQGMVPELPEFAREREVASV
jgi:hypothetical protein